MVTSLYYTCLLSLFILLNRLPSHDASNRDCRHRPSLWTLRRKRSLIEIVLHPCYSMYVFSLLPSFSCEEDQVWHGLWYDSGKVNNRVCYSTLLYTFNTDHNRVILYLCKNFARYERVSWYSDEKGNIKNTFVLCCSQISASEGLVFEFSRFILVLGEEIKERIHRRGSSYRQRKGSKTRRHQRLLTRNGSFV